MWVRKLEMFKSVYTWLGIVILAISLAYFPGCEKAGDVKSEIQRLKESRHTFAQQVLDLDGEKKRLVEVIQKLNQDERVLRALQEGKKIRYILKLELRQRRKGIDALDIGKQWKDAANAIEFELPVDQKLYEAVAVGTNLVDEFRGGSLFFGGSFSSWEMKIKGKRIQTPEQADLKEITGQSYKQ